MLRVRSVSFTSLLELKFMVNCTIQCYFFLVESANVFVDTLQGEPEHLSQVIIFG